MASNESESAATVVAVIDIGASAIRMAIAEVTEKGDIRVLETPARPVAIGRDVFTTGRISRPTRLEVIDVLRGFHELMDTYQVEFSRIIATSALREAQDRDTFLDWAFIRTGLDIEVIEPIEENQLTFSAVQNVLGERLAEARDALIMEVGGGSTELVIMHRGEISLSQVLPLGAVRMRQKLADSATTSTARVRLLAREVGGAIEIVQRDMSLAKVMLFVAVGSEMRFAARRLAESDDERSIEVPADEFLSFVKETSRLDVDGIVDRFGLPFADAETLVPTLSVYSNFLEQTEAKAVVVPMVSIRDGLLADVAAIVSGRRRSDFSRQVLASARAIGSKYQYDRKHALHVTKLALRLFDELGELHTLGRRERLLLEVAGILHDVGTFIANSAHHKHSRYVVNHSDIFGLRKMEKNVLAEVVRYHRKATPKPTHVEYMSLPRNDRVVVSKLAGILRVADALDRTHLQRVSDFEVQRKIDSLVIRVPGVDDLSVERAGLIAKGDLFEDVFGMTVVLEEAGKA